MPDNPNILPNLIASTQAFIIVTWERDLELESSFPEHGLVGSNALREQTALPATKH